MLFVTLHVSVWVEIWVSYRLPLSEPVTLHVSVWVEIVMTAWIIVRIVSRSTWACELKWWTGYLVYRCCGHAPRERVSWNVHAERRNSLLPVTLHVSVWVEIRAVRPCWGLQTVTLHVSVWVEIYGDKAETLRAESRSTWACELKCWEVALSAAPWGHAPRERVSWNVYGRHIGLVSVVTLHVSVWVEIDLANQYNRDVMSRSTWACELKLNIFILLICSSCHAPRERVSWNMNGTDISVVTLRSRSTWACELKCVQKQNVTEICCHAPRERVSWNAISPITFVDCWSRSTWACELKCTC